MRTKFTVSKRIFGMLLALAITAALSPLSATTAYADDADALAATINSYGGALEAAPEGDTVTVTGAFDGATATLVLDIDSGVTVKWGATLTADAASPPPFLINLPGAGNFDMTGGAVSANGDGSYAVIAGFGSTTNITLSGGAISAEGNNSYAIGTYSGAVTVSGGTVGVKGNNSYAVITTSGSVTVSGGAVSAEGNGCVAVCAQTDACALTISGGTVSSNGLESYVIYGINAASAIEIANAVLITDQAAAIGGASANITKTSAIEFTGAGGAATGDMTLGQDLILPDDLTILSGAKLTIPVGATLTVPPSKTLTNNGTIIGGGAIIGIVDGNPVIVPATGVTLNKLSAVLAVGGTETLTATITPTGATIQTMTWNSDNTGVATVADGLITAVSAGTATIAVTTTDGSFTARCAVTVSGSDSNSVSNNGGEPATSDADSGFNIWWGIAAIAILALIVFKRKK